MDTIRIAAAQTPEFRRDIPAALAGLNRAAGEAEAQGARLLVFPEGYLQGYLTQAHAAAECALDLGSTAFAAILEALPATGPMLVFGLIERQGEDLFNTAVVVQARRLVGRYRKAHLLAGEACFRPGATPGIFETDGLKFGVNICADTTVPEAARAVADGGARLLVCPANNMMRRGAAIRWKDAHNAVRGERCRETGLWLISADVTGERPGRLGADGGADPCR